MSYMDRAIQFLQDLQQVHDRAEVGDEINETNEINPPAVEVLDGDVWWDEANFASSAPIRHLPPQECFAPRACSRLGPCDRHLAGNPCLVTRC